MGNDKTTNECILLTGKLLSLEDKIESINIRTATVEHHIGSLKRVFDSLTARTNGMEDRISMLEDEEGISEHSAEEDFGQHLQHLRYVWRR